MIQIIIYVTALILVLALGGLGYFTIYRLTLQVDTRGSTHTEMLESEKDEIQKLQLTISRLDLRLLAIETNQATQLNFLRKIKPTEPLNWEPIKK